MMAGEATSWKSVNQTSGGTWRKYLGVPNYIFYI